MVGAKEWVREPTNETTADTVGMREHRGPCQHQKRGKTSLSDRITNARRRSIAGTVELMDATLPGS
jgi:hypothetical protein